VTAILCFLAFVAVANAVSGGVLALFAGHRRFHAGYLVVEVGLGVLLSVWARARVRKQHSQEVTGPSVPPREGRSELEAGSRVRASRRGGSRLRWARWALTVGVIALAVVTVGSQWGTLRSGVEQLTHLDWRNLRLALYAEALSLIALAQLTRLLLATGGVRLRLGSVLGLTVASNAMVLTLPGGPALGASFSFDQLRRRGVRTSLSAYAVAVTFIFISVALVVIALVGIDLAGGAGPAAPFRLVATAATCLMASLAVACGLALRRPRCRGRLERKLATLSSHPRWGRRVARLREWVGELASVRLPALTLLRCLAVAMLNWICDCGCLVFSILAVGGHVPWQAVLAAYGLTQLAAMLPITPGGIGVVEATLSVLLIAYHMPAPKAVAAVILYRIISYWIVVPVGWATVGALLAIQRQRRGRARAGQAPSAAPVTGAPATAA
jgi:putative heme transporter